MHVEQAGHDVRPLKVDHRRVLGPGSRARGPDTGDPAVPDHHILVTADAGAPAVKHVAVDKNLRLAHGLSPQTSAPGFLSANPAGRPAVRPGRYEIACAMSPAGS